MPRLVLDAFTFEFRKTKDAAEKAFAQLRDEDFHFRLHPEQCSIATYVQHMAGNMRSRWTDFLTTDGEKPYRNREGEFVDLPHSRDEILRIWNDGWSILFATLDSLTDEDLSKTVTIRTEPHTVALAITRQLAHYAWHVGQIILLAKHLVALRGDKWSYITIAPGASSAFNKEKGIK
jgi:hypothetical protein